jgi:hypothetical protein
MSWSAAFETPIALPDGRELVTLMDAGEYIAALPAAAQKRPEWQAATVALMLVAERGGATMLAKIGIMRALNAGKPPPAPEPRTKRAKVYRLIR